MSSEKKLKLDNETCDFSNFDSCVSSVNIYKCKYFNDSTTSSTIVGESADINTGETKGTSIADTFLHIECNLAAHLCNLPITGPVEYVYSPLKYAYNVHSKYVRTFCHSTKKVMFLGMNPGPWGMSQTGVPFGEVAMVRDWMGITGIVEKPERENPARPVLGFDCKRSEISGKRFWGLFKELCGEPSNFFHNAIVYNYCPVSFMTETGKNMTPSELKISERKLINLLCDEALKNVLQLFEISIIIAIGQFARKRAVTVVKASGMTNIKIETILHPSPRNFRVGNWEDVVAQRLRDLDLMQYFSV